MIQSSIQGAGSQAAAPWTIAQIHDTVAKIAAQPVYGSAGRESLLGRFLRYLWDRFTDFLKLFEGSVNARVALIVGGVLVVGVIAARIVVARELDHRSARRLRNVRASLGGRLDYWTLARDEAAAGRYAEASHALYAALIDTLVHEGMMKFHASKTSGDYARDLRRAGSPVVGDFHSFSRHFDRVIFGEMSVGADDYARLRESAERAARIRATA